MPTRKGQEPKREFRVGENVRAELHTGEIVNAVIGAVIPRREGVQLQVDFGEDETALIDEWQVVSES